MLVAFTLVVAVLVRFLAPGARKAAAAAESRA